MSLELHVCSLIRRSSSHHNHTSSTWVRISRISYYGSSFGWFGFWNGTKIICAVVTMFSWVSESLTYKITCSWSTILGCLNFISFFIPCSWKIILMQFILSPFGSSLTLCLTFPWSFSLLHFFHAFKFHQISPCTIISMHKQKNYNWRIEFFEFNLILFGLNHFI